MVKIEQVSADIVRPLRHKVLRSNLPFEASIMLSDDFSDSAHFLVKKDGIIKSVASIYKEPFEKMPTYKGYRLRGMATEPSEKGKGFGSLVLKGVVQYLKNNTDAKILWCNSRVVAFGFYEKMGFKIMGDVFEIPNLGAHKTGYFKL